MIKFFRHIRKQLLGEGNTGRYLKYAIGEIVLVMIGILLALQVNNWNNDRSNKRQELHILQQLKGEFEVNLFELEQKEFMREEMIKGIESILFISDFGYKTFSLDSIDKLIHLSLVNPTFDPSVGVTEELLNSGKLYLIQNEQLKYHLTTWSGKHNNLKEEEQILVKILSPDYWKYIRENYPYRNMMKKRKLVDKFIKNFTDSNQNGNEYEIKGVKDKLEYERFINDPIIINYLQDIKFNLILTIAQASSLEEKINTILAIINEELNEKK
jgi:hypothetical protein